jgi:hypothetical protein
MGTARSRMRLATLPISFGSKITELDWSLITSSAWRNSSRKHGELYPESELQTDTIFLSGDQVIMEWNLQTILMEPFYSGVKLRVPVSLRGASIVRTENGKITDWAEYYDLLTARRTALAAHFAEWVEY